MPRPRRGERERAIPLGQAVVLGIVQGPTELVPISSSGHLTLLPWLLRWDWSGLDPELRKAFEVALHCGAMAALVISWHDALAPRTARRRVLLALSVAPAALLGYLFERQIQKRLGTPPTVALGMLVGGLALARADKAPQARGRGDADWRDALWLGLAQAGALFPGVSRGGATLAAARSRGFSRPDAQQLSRELALPVIVGAAVLKGVRLRARPLPAAARGPFLAGAVASFVSTLISIGLLGPAVENRPLAPYATYRVALAAAVLARSRSAPRALGRASRLLHRGRARA
jgi:undecaprenyl-diphosphatase